MTSISFWGYHWRLWPLVGVNAFCIAWVVVLEVSHAIIPIDQYVKIISYGGYPLLMLFYLFLYWKLNSRGFNWNKALQQIHLFGSVVLGTIFYVGRIRWLIENSAPRRYYLFSPRSYFSQFSDWTYQHMGEIMVIAALLFLFAQLLFLINLIVTLRRGKSK
jgi:heme/copper-type cytochrome/quinol oxidase subunit 1